MKKIIVVVTIMTVILTVVIVKYKDIYIVYKMNQLKKDTINCINGVFSKRINERTIKDYKRLHIPNVELNHNNITALINIYISSVHNGMNIYIKNNEEEVKGEGKYNEVNSFSSVEKGNDIWMKYYDIDYAAGESFTNVDVRNYKDGTFKALLIEKLKSCLDYEENDGKIEWYINSVEDKVIELPYNCYIDYKAYNFELNTNFKRAINVDVSNFDFAIGGGIKLVTYETKDGSTKTQNIDIYRQDDGKYYISLSRILGELKNNIAECTLSSHTLDRWKEEQRRETDRMVFSDWSD